MRILIGIDESKSSRKLCGAVITQFRPQNNEVRILHVLQPVSVSAPPEMARDFTPEIEGQKKQAEALLDKATKKMASAGFHVDSVTAQGDAREVLIDLAQEWHADLIVVGSHGSSGIRRFLLGSVAESLARHAPCSVEVVRIPASARSAHSKEAKKKALNILVAIDDSKFSKAAVKMVVQQLRSDDTKICLLHVVPPVLLSPDYGGIEAVETEQHRRRESAKALLERYKQLLIPEGFEVITAVQDGDPRSGILDYATERKAT